MKRVLMTAAAVLALGLAASPVRGATVTFDGGTLQTFSGLLSGIYTEAGLEFDIYGAAPDFVADGHGGHALQINLVNDIIIHPTAGGPFSLSSFYFLGGGDTYWGGFHNDFTSGGENNHAGADIGFFLDGLANTVHPLADDPAWGNITTVDWCGYCISGFEPQNAIDNVTFDLPAHGGVPEPGPWTLMILGFGGLGAELRRRRLIVLQA